MMETVVEKVCLRQAAGPSIEEHSFLFILLSPLSPFGSRLTEAGSQESSWIQLM